MKSFGINLVNATWDKTFGVAAIGRVLLAALVALFCAVPGAATARADIVYDQPPVFPAQFSSWTSDVDPANNGWRAWDNFTLSQATSISGVNWQGFYLDTITRENNPVAPETESWELSFWSNFDGQPSAPIQSQILPVAAVTTTFVASTSFLGYTVPVFDFHADLTPFLAQTGTTYWLSVLSNSPTFNPLWSWMQGTGGDNNTAQDILPAGTRLVRPGDRTFSLEGQLSVPEPTVPCLVALSLFINCFVPILFRNSTQNRKE
jgi:hypothetical protein